MSWKQYGGINKLDKLNNISVNTVSTDSLIIREPILGNLDICGNVVIDGSLVIHNYLDIKKNSLFEGNVLMSRNLDISKNVVIDGNLIVKGLLTTNNTLILDSLGINVDFDVSRNTTLHGNASLYNYVFFDFSNSSVFLKGNSASNNLGLNVSNPQSTLDICGNSISSLNVFSKNEFTRNVLVQNQNKRGISMFSNTRASGIQFYNDGSLNSGTHEGTHENDGTNRGVLIQYDSSGGVFNIDVSNNTVMNSRLAISNRGLNTIDGHILNETVVIYDISSAPSTQLNPYLYDIYNNNTESTGNALSLITKDSSSNTFMNIITPQKKGVNIGGGAYPNDQTRSMGVISYLDVSGRPIPSLMMVSGNNSVLNRSTIGINTYTPRTEKYSFNVNGPVHITNGQINKIVKAGFEITQLSAMNTFGNSVIAVGKPSYIGNTTQNIPYLNNLYYSNDGGQNWILNTTFGNGTDLSRNYYNINAVFTYYGSSTYSIIVGDNGYIFDSSNNGQNWNKHTLISGAKTIQNNFQSVYVGESQIYFVDISNIFITTKANLVANSVSDFTTITNSNNLNNFKQIKANQENIFIAGGNGISVYSTIPPFTVNINLQHKGSQYNYNSIDVSSNNIVAVGANIISYSTNGGTNWTDNSFLNITFNSVLIVDSSNAITVGGNNVYYSSNGYSTWQPVPYDILNSSGNAADLLNSTNSFKSITMTTDKSTFLISSTTQIGNTTQVGKSNIYYCFLPNLFNRVNNNVFDVCGNMHLAGDITIDNNLYANGGDESNVPSNGTLVVSGGVGISGNTNIGGNTNITKNTTMGGNLTINANTVSTSIGSGSLIINGGAGISGNVNIGRETQIKGNTLMLGNLMIQGNCDTDSISNYQLIIAGNTDANQRISIGYKQGSGGYIETQGSSATFTPLYINSLGTKNSPQDTYIGNRNSSVYIKGTVILEGDPTSVSAVDVSGSFSIKNNLNVINFLDDYQISCAGTIANGGNNKAVYIGYVLQSGNINDLGYGSIQTCIGNLSGTASSNTIDNYTPLYINTIGTATNPQNTTIGHIGSFVQIGGNMFVINDASLSGNLFVAQDVSMNNRLYLGGNASLNGNLYVVKDVSMNNRLYLGGDASLNGNLYVVKDVSMNKCLYLGGDASLNGNLYVVKDVSMNNRLYLGGDASLNGNLYVVQDVSMNKRLYLGGDASLNGNLYVVKDVSMNKRLYLGGDASLNGNLFVAQETKLNGNATLNGNLFLVKDASFNRNFFLGKDASFNGRLFVASDASFNGNLSITGNTKVNNNLIVINDSSLNGNLYLQNDAWFLSNLDVSLNTNIGGVLTVDLDTIIYGNLIGQSSVNFLSWSGDVSFNRSLFLAGDVSLNGNLYVVKDVSMNKRLFLGGDASLNGNLYVVQDVSMNRRLYLGGDASLNGNLYVVKDVSMNNSLYLGGDASLNGNLYVVQDVSMNKRLYLGGDASLNGKLFVAQDVSFNGKISVLSTSNFNSNVFMNSNWINFNTGNSVNNGYGINWADSTSRIYDNGNMHIYTNDNLFFDVNGIDNTKMFINFNGNVGIGTINPLYTLDVSGNSRVSDNITINNTIFGNLTSTGTSKFNIINGNSITITDTTSNFPTGTTGSLIIKHNTSGGASSIMFPSKINDGSDFGYIAYVDNVSQGNTFLLSTLTSFNYFSANNTEASALIIGCENDGISNSGPDSVIITPAGCIALTPRQGITYISGNVGIGTTTPAYALDVSGSSRIPQIFFNGSTTRSIALQNDGNFVFYENSIAYANIDSVGNMNCVSISCTAITSTGAFTNGSNTLGCGAITSGTISCTAITSTGAFTNGFNTLGCGAITSGTISCTAITSTGAFTNGSNTLGCGAITSGTISCTAITSTGAFTNGSNTLGCGTISCGAITSTGAFTNGSNTLGCGTISCGTITSTGAFTNGSNTLGCGTISCGAITSTGAFTNGSNTITTTGQISGGSFNATSDYRIKEIIEPLNTNYTIDNLKPIHYKNKLTNKDDIGFLAHEVQELYPFLVSGNKDEMNENGEPKYQSINYNGLIGLLVNEIQLLKKEIKEIKEKTGL